MDQAVYLEPRETLQSIKRRARQVNMMRFICNVTGNKPLTVYYEDLVRDYRETMSQVCHFLGIGNVGIFQRSALKKRQTRSKGEAIQNYEEIKAVLSHDGFGYLIDS